MDALGDLDTLGEGDAHADTVTEELALGALLCVLEPPDGDTDNEPRCGLGLAVGHCVFDALDWRLLEDVRETLGHAEVDTDNDERALVEGDRVELRQPEPLKDEEDDRVCDRTGLPETVTDGERLGDRVRVPESDGDTESDCDTVTEGEGDADSARLTEADAEPHMEDDSDNAPDAELKRDPETDPEVEPDEEAETCSVPDRDPDGEADVVCDRSCVAEDARDRVGEIEGEGLRLTVRDTLGEEDTDTLRDARPDELGERDKRADLDSVPEADCEPVVEKELLTEGDPEELGTYEFDASGETEPLKLVSPENVDASEGDGVALVDTDIDVLVDCDCDCVEEAECVRDNDAEEVSES